MHKENNKTVKSGKARKIQSVDKSRRSFTKIGAITPVIMTLASKSALGQTPYQCTVSGQMSGNHSSHNWTTQCNVGFSPGAWKTPGESGDGNIHQWKTAGCNPHTTTPLNQNAVKGFFSNTGSESYKTGTQKTFGNLQAKDAFITLSSPTYVNATTFKQIFGGTNSKTLHQILMQDTGSLEFHAVADYLNAKLHQASGAFSPVYDNITPEYIVSVYNYDNTKLSPEKKKEYFISIHHPTP